MKTLILKDGTVLEFTNSSTIFRLVTVLRAFSEVDSIRSCVTEENLSEVTFDGKNYKDLMFGGITADAMDYANVQVGLYLKTQASEEIDELKKQVAELEAENEQLINQNEQLTDKAEATDILLGNEEV